MAKYCPYKEGEALYPECTECRDKACEYFFCLVVGSRTFDNYPLMEKKLDHLLQNKAPKVVIVSGHARGADSCAEKYAKERGYLLKVFPAQWDKYGKSAGYKRNLQMHEFIAKFKDRGCVAFWKDQSKGTAHNFGLAEKFGTNIVIINC